MALHTEILKEKAANDVEIRVMYDDVGTINLLERDYHKKLNSYGIKTVIFNRSGLLSILF